MRHRPAALPVALAALSAAMLAALGAGLVGAALIPTTTTLTVPPSPIALFEPVQLTATVSPIAAPGAVEFVIDGQGRGTGFLFNGVASATVPSPGIGEHIVTAVYAGTGTYAASSSAPQTIEVVDVRQPVSVGVEVDPSAVMRGDPVTISASIDPPPGAGAVTLYGDGTPFAFNLPVQPDGSVELTRSFSASSTYAIKACFEGNATYLPGCSAPVSLIVTSLASTTSLTIEPATVYPDEPFTIGVTVDPPPEVDTAASVGTTPNDRRTWITIDADTGYGEVTITDDVDHVFSLGSFDLRAYYPGSTHVDPSASEPVNLTIRLQPSSLTSGVTAGPVTVGDPITFSAHVEPGPTVPSAGVGFTVFGPVETGFSEHPGITLGGSSSGETTIDTDGWPAGEYTYTASFGGDPHLAPSADQGTFTMVDVDPPTGEVAIAEDVDTVIGSSVVVDVPASDGVGSGVTIVALSNDGSAWHEQAYDPDVPPIWSLAAGDGARTVFARWRDQAGNWSTVAQDGVVVDGASATPGVPTVSIAKGSAVSAAGRVPVRVSWLAPSSSELIVGYRLEDRVDAGPWTLATETADQTSVVRSVAPGHAIQFRVQAVAGVAGAGPWSTQPGDVTLTGYQQSSSKVAFSKHWTKVRDKAAWGGSYQRSETKGAAATVKVTARSIAWVSRTGPSRGVAKVFVDGRKVATVDLRSSSVTPRRVVWTMSWSTQRVHRVQVRVAGTHGRPWVEVDGFVALN